MAGDVLYIDLEVLVDTRIPDGHGEKKYLEQVCYERMAPGVGLPEEAIADLHRIRKKHSFQDPATWSDILATYGIDYDIEVLLNRDWPDHINAAAEEAAVQKRNIPYWISAYSEVLESKGISVRDSVLEKMVRGPAATSYIASELSRASVSHAKAQEIAPDMLLAAEEDDIASLKQTLQGAMESGTKIIIGSNRPYRAIERVVYHSGLSDKISDLICFSGGFKGTASFNNLLRKAGVISDDEWDFRYLKELQADRGVYDGLKVVTKSPWIFKTAKNIDLDVIGVIQANKSAGKIRAAMADAGAQDGEIVYSLEDLRSRMENFPDHVK